jgi:D-inositol-3-phosphate glycosyltransferase
MKICLVGPVYPYRGGISHSHTLLGEALESAGHEIQVISFKRQYPSRLYPGQSDKDPSLKTSRLPVAYFLDPIYPWTWLKTARAICAFHPDLVIFQWWTVFWAPAWAWLNWQLHRYGLKTVYFIHNVLPHEPGRLDPWLARLALRQGDGYITLTGREQQRLRDLLSGLSKPVFTTPLPAYQLGNQPTVSKKDARARLGLPAETPILLFFGLVRPYKGLHYLIEACGQLTAEPSRPLLVVAGEFWEDPQIYQTQITRLKLDEWVRLENRYLPDEEAALWFCAADLFIAPYIDGTQSAALRVALGYGLPVIATDRISGELSDLAPSILNIVPAGDAEALAQAIHKRLINPPKPTTLPPIEEQWKRMVDLIGQAGRAISTQR